MKRASRALVAYSSSEDEALADGPERKKKKLPSLASSIIVPVPVDDPTLHQGRVRATPHVEGQYAAYVYIPLVVHPGTALYSLVDEVLNVTKEMVPAAHVIGEIVSCSRNSGGLVVNSSRKVRELHLSLTRPIFLRAHQREEFKQAIKRIASRRTPFQASFATFSELTNDERTRAFLSLEVGAGHNELRELLSALSPTLQSLRQRDFYSQPRFHVSIAWALLDLDTSVNGDANTKRHPCAYEGVTAVEGTSDNNLSSNGDIGESNKHFQAEYFPRVPHLPSKLIPTLNQRFGARVSSAHIGRFDVDTIVVKIGKDIFSWPFQGSHANLVSS
ncbi:uncharacterized protein BJ212DRAFT_1477047 [Suillus subaureus]|uniref:U6 snRNA phosphodiesterase n=1 Tax=Suillus subaureus TaxID=48587 RepID=A0A9P7EJ96_9AGAM|nr:uncharacterized protein BJ212DRAFT_1477047 [Suillus subaureus]KAG1822621.1 hypothetical protein BJ212DRAFT_1477047 [Suillus subaureus]